MRPETAAVIVTLVIAGLSLATQWGGMRAAGRAITRKLDELDKSVRRLEADTCVLQEQVTRINRHIDGEITAVGRRIPKRPRDGE